MKTQTPASADRESRKNSPRRIDRSIVIVAAMAAIGVLLISLVQMTTVSAREAQRREERRRRIANMSADERDQLERKSKRFFEDFDEQKRESLRELHQGLESAENAEALRKTLTRYNKWLATLSPYERDELRDKLDNAASTDSRLQIISDAKAYQDRQKWLRSLPRSDRERLKKLDEKSAEYEQAIQEIRSRQEEQLAKGESQSPVPRSRGRFGSRSRSGPRLASADLDAALGMILANMNLSESQRTELSEVSEIRRRVRILHEAAKMHDVPEGAPQQGFLDDESLKTLIQASKLKPELKKKLVSSADSAGGRWGILRMLFGSTMREMFARNSRPSDEELSKFVETMSARDRAQLIRYRGDELQRWLEFKYNNQRRASAYRDNRELFKTLGKLPGWKWYPPKRSGGPGRTGRRANRGG